TSSNSVTLQVTPAPPAITTINPTTILAGSQAFVMTVTGAGFVEGAAVMWNGSPLNTAFVSGTQLTVSIPAALVAEPGSPAISVTNPNGAASTAVALVVNKPNTPASLPPVISALLPAIVTAGAPAFSLAING